MPCTRHVDFGLVPRPHPSRGGKGLEIQLGCTSRGSLILVQAYRFHGERVGSQVQDKLTFTTLTQIDI